MHIVEHNLPVAITSLLYRQYLKREREMNQANQENAFEVANKHTLNNNVNFLVEKLGICELLFTLQKISNQNKNDVSNIP